MRDSRDGVWHHVLLFKGNVAALIIASQNNPEGWFLSCFEILICLLLRLCIVLKVRLLNTPYCMPTTPHITLRNARLLLLQEILSLENMARRQYFLWKLCSFN